VKPRGKFRKPLQANLPPRSSAVGTEPRYKLGREGFGAPELSAMVLSALKSDAEAHLGVEVSDVVISYPAYFNELQRKAVRAVVAKYASGTGADLQGNPVALTLTRGPA
jgi:molecular chaperone HscC